MSAEGEAGSAGHGAAAFVPAPGDAAGHGEEEDETDHLIVEPGDQAGPRAPQDRPAEPEHPAELEEPGDRTMESAPSRGADQRAEPRDRDAVCEETDNRLTEPQGQSEAQAVSCEPEDRTEDSEGDTEPVEAEHGMTESGALEDQAGSEEPGDHDLQPQGQLEDQAETEDSLDRTVDSGSYTEDHDEPLEPGDGTIDDLTGSKEPEDETLEPENVTGAQEPRDETAESEDTEEQPGSEEPGNCDEDPKDHAGLGEPENQTVTPEPDRDDQAGPEQPEDQSIEYEEDIEEEAEPEEPEDQATDPGDQIRPADVDDIAEESVKLEGPSGSEEPEDEDIVTEDQIMPSEDLEDHTVPEEPVDQTNDPDNQVECEKADDENIEPENLTGTEEPENQTTISADPEDQAKQEEPGDRTLEPEEDPPEQLGELTIDNEDQSVEPEALAQQGYQATWSAPSDLVWLQDPGDVVLPREVEDLAGKPGETADELVEPIEFEDVAKPEGAQTGSRGKHVNERWEPMLGALPKEPRDQGEPGDLIDVALDQDESRNLATERGQPRGPSRPRDLGSQAIRSWDVTGLEEDSEKLLGMTEDPDDSEGSVEPGAHVYHVYARRWFVLGVLCLLNLSNAMIWLSFAPIADKTAAFFGISPAQVNWLAIVFLVACVPCGIVASWSMDRTGLRVTLLLGSWLNALGSVLRALSDHPLMPKALRGFPLLMTGQTMGALAQPFLLFAPTKLAAVWFPENQRATANTLASMSNPLGILLANVLSPIIVYEADQMPMMLYLYCLPAVLACALATCGVCSGSPPTPPSLGASHPTGEPFWRSVKAVMTNKPYLVLFFCFGAGVALFTAFTTLLEQILCSRGYSDGFSGMCGALTIGFGILGAGIVGLYVDRYKKFVEVTKINFCLAALAACMFAMVCGMREEQYVIAVACCLFGMFGFSIYPVCMELGVECTYPVGEATSSGILFISGQLQGVLYIVLMQAVTRPLPPGALPSAVCHGDGVTPQDWTVSVLLFAGIAVLGACGMVVAFRTEYRRRRAEAVESSDNEPLLP